MARLAEQDRERVRYHLGYLNVDPVSAVQLGFPSAAQAEFLVERAMDRVREQTVGRIIRILNELDDCELQISEGRKRLKVQQIETLKLRNSNEEPTELDLVRGEYRHWAESLADNLGVPLNTYSYRFRGGGPGAGITNVPVAQV